METENQNKIALNFSPDIAMDENKPIIMTTEKKGDSLQ